MNFNKNIQKIIMFITLNILISIIYLFFPDSAFNGLKMNNVDTALNKWFERFYFSVVSSTTLGYGDITPNTMAIKTIVIIQVLITFSILAL